jgi:phospholipase C
MDAAVPTPSWTVYHDTVLVPSLTRTMFPKLWPESLDGRFRSFDEFLNDCAHGRLPQYAFVEPSFLLTPKDDHPPHDVNAGQVFLHAIWTAVSTSPGFAKTLLVITYDEHGGCYDHVLPPFGATPPDPSGPPGDQGFTSTASAFATPTSAAPNDLQRSLVSGSARRYGLDPSKELAQIQTRQHAVDFFRRRGSMARP